MDKKYTLVIGLAVFTLVLLISTSAQAEHWFGINYKTLEYRVNNMPEDFRFVPIHKDDWYARPSNNGPIEQTKYRRDHWVSLEYGYSWEKGKWDLGIGFLWIFSNIGDFDDVELRNYTNHPGTSTRGYGAALTFVSTEIRGLVPKTDEDFIDFIFNFSPKIFAEYSLDKEGQFRLGANLSYHQYNALNGYDRYDDYEVKDTETLAHIFPLAAQVTLFNFLTLGATYNLRQLTSFGKRADTDIGELSYTIKFEGKF